MEVALADYLLIQERLDFRRGRGLRGPVDGHLLRRWTRAVIATEQQRWEPSSTGFQGGADWADELRQFCRLRAIPLDPPSEVRAGAKVGGLQAIIEAALRGGRGSGRLTVVSDLCGLSDVESLRRPVAAARRRGWEIRFLVLRTSHYVPGDVEASERQQIVRDLFTRAERRDRLEVARRLAAMGLQVRFLSGQPPQYVA